MKIKADWPTWLHAYKVREIDKTFYACPEGCFGSGLELGAGDGFQSGLLSKYVRRLVSTEINKLYLSRQEGGGVEYRVCSAEEAVAAGGDGSHDLVFSSNVLEHLPDPAAVLRGIHRVLKDDGVTIHIVPTPLWKLCHVLLYVPVTLAALAEQVVGRRGNGGMLREARFFFGQFVEGVRKGANTLTERADREEALRGNNPGIVTERRTFVRRLLAPRPHGVSETNLAEFSALGRRRWLGMFGQAGLECFAILNGPAASGYGLGWRWAEAAAEKAGLASELIYVAHKKGRQCRYAPFFS